MRDPRGALRLSGDHAVRTLNGPLAPDDFLLHPLASQLVQQGKLVDFCLSSLTTIQSPRFPFVSYPDEWTDAQLFDAATLTLDICERLAPTSHQLKDASAWNIIFDGCRPVFCDHLSFETIKDRHWWAFGQFVRHFVFPLGAARWRNVSGADIFRIHRDGLPPSRARALLGMRRFLTRQWPLMMEAPGSTPVPAQVHDSVSRYHQRLFHFLRWQLSGVRPRRGRGGGWVGYEATRSHYSEASINQKRSVVGSWVERLGPRWVVDLGCNLGEFSLICANLGARVIAVDSDLRCIDSLYRAQRGRELIHPVVANIGDLSGGRGWAGQEFSGLTSRLTGLADVVLALGLVHHLAITDSIPIAAIVEFLGRCSRRHLIIECIDETDPLVRHLCDQRGRHPAEFSMSEQLSCLASTFRVCESVELTGTKRRLVLLEKLDA